MKKLALITALLLLSGCAYLRSNPESGLITTTATGAGVGALAGAVISNGDILMSGGLGTAIGLGAGLAIKGYDEYQNKVDIAETVSQLDDNQEQIYETERALRILRRRHQDIHQDKAPLSGQREAVFDGVTLGTYNR